MAIGTLENIGVECVACAVPTKKMTAEDYIPYYGERVVKRFVRTTGVENRYWVHEKQTAADLCFVAAEKIIEEKKIPREEIGALVFLTQTPDYKTPSTAFVLQHRLGLSQEAIVFDINIGCTAVIHGIHVLAGMLQNSDMKYALLLAGDALPKRKITEDHTDSMMFGDAGAALLLKKSENRIHYLLRTDGSGFQAIMNPAGERFPLDMENPDWSKFKYYLNGGQVFNFAVDTVPQSIKQFREYFSLSKDDIDYYIFHQANKFILKHIANELEIDFDKAPLSIDSYGNTNGASIMTTIVDMYSKGLFDTEKKVLISGFGIGLSWGVMDLTIDNSNVLPMIFTDDYYAEGTDIQY